MYSCPLPPPQTHKHTDSWTGNPARGCWRAWSAGNFCAVSIRSRIRTPQVHPSLGPGELRRAPWATFKLGVRDHPEKGGAEGFAHPLAQQAPCFLLQAGLPARPQASGGRNRRTPWPSRDHLGPLWPLRFLPRPPSGSRGPRRDPEDLGGDGDFGVPPGWGRPGHLGAGPDTWGAARGGAPGPALPVDLVRKGAALGGSHGTASRWGPRAPRPRARRPRRLLPGLGSPAGRGGAGPGRRRGPSGCPGPLHAAPAGRRGEGSPLGTQGAVGKLRLRSQAKTQRLENRAQGGRIWGPQVG